MKIEERFRKAPSWFLNIVLILAAFFTYILFSKLGDFFVIPPGFVSVMWPAAGVALGFVYAFGNKVAIGIFLARFVMIISIYTAPDASDIIIALMLSAGATLHAVVGSALIRRFTNSEFYMGSLKDIVIFLLLGGPLACLLTAFIGGLTFTNLGNLPADQFFKFVETWWAGDVFGVIVFAPLTVIILSHIQRRKTLTASSLTTIIVPLIISISIFTIVFDSVKKQLLQHTYDEYSEDVSHIINQFTEILAVDITAINATASYMEASEHVTASEFRIFTKPLLNKFSGLYGLSWLPKVSYQRRDLFVKDIQSQGYLDFEIKIRDDKGVVQTSKKKQVYYPITYLEPYERNGLAQGLDVYGQGGVFGATRRESLDEARDLGVARASNRFIGQGKYRFIIHYPVFRGFNDAHGREHIGYINGVFVFPELVRSLVEPSSFIGSEFFLTEISADMGPKLLFDSRTSDNKEGTAASYELNKVVHFERGFDVAGKRWKITFIKNLPLLEGDYGRSIWALAGGGALFNTLFLIILMMIASQNNFVQKLVEKRTRDLRHANEELEEFAYRTSHDLRSPIVSSVTLLSLADEAIRDGNTEIASKSISHAQKSLGKLDILISDILTLTQIGSTNETDVFLKIPDVIDDAICKLDHADGFEKLSIELDIRFEDEILTKPTRLQLIFENLISNAAKYHDPDEANPTLKISCYPVDEDLYLEFSDNGLGIPEEYRNQVFDMFKRFHPKVAGGTGLGLYLMKRSARVLDGEISYQPLEKGSLFRIIIPIKQV